MPTLLEIMVLAGELAGKVSSGSVGAGSTTQVLVDPDLRDTGVDPAHHGGKWLYMPSAAAGDEQRQTTERPFDRTTGSLRVTRPWGVAPVADSDYYLFSPWPAMPHPDYPHCWRDAVNEALVLMEFEDRVPLTAVTGESGRFTLAAIDGWSPYPAAVSQVFTRYGVTNYYDQNANRNGNRVRKYMDQGVLTVELLRSPSGHAGVYADVVRPQARLTDHDDVTIGGLDLQTAAYGAVWQYMKLSNASDGDVAMAWKDWYNRYNPQRPPVRVSY